MNAHIINIFMNIDIDTAHMLILILTLALVQMQKPSMKIIDAKCNGVTTDAVANKKTHANANAIRYFRCWQ